MTPHALDLTIAIILLLSTLVGYFRGIVREFFMLAGIALASYVAVKGGHLLVPEVAGWLGAHPNGEGETPTVLGMLKPTVATDVISYGGLFLGVFIVMIIFRMMISHWVNGAGLTVADRVGGAFFGFARGFLLVLVIFATCLYMTYAGETDQLPEWAKNSVSVPVLEKSLAWADKNVDIKGDLKMISDKIEHTNFDKVHKEAGEVEDNIKAEVKHEEQAIQKAPDAPAPAPAPVAPVTDATLPNPNAPPAPVPMPAPAAPTPPTPPTNP